MRRCKKHYLDLCYILEVRRICRVKNMIKKLLKKNRKVKLNGYNCSPCDYYRPKKPSK